MIAGSHRTERMGTGSMELDEELCLCFHVTKRKVVNFLRVERPQRAGQLSECFGAGTGCGWCRPFLRRLFQEAQAGCAVDASFPSSSRYAELRADYIRAGHGTPPGGQTPSDPVEDSPTGD